MADTSDPEIEFRDENGHDDINDNGGGDVGANTEEDEINAEEEEVTHQNDTEADQRPIQFDRGDFGGGFPYFHPGQKSLTLKPEPYSGLEDWEEYLSHFELCAELGRWREHDKRLALGASLRGSARTFYLSLPSEDKGNYGRLIQQLGQRFGSTRQHNRWLSKLEMRKRLPGESISKLSDDLRQMSQRAYPKLDVTAQEAIALNQLYKCIPLEMKCKCIDRECTTVSQAVEIIERYEAVMGEPQEKKKMLTVRGISGGSPNNNSYQRQNNNGYQRQNTNMKDANRWNKQQENSQLSKAISELTARLDRMENRPHIQMPYRSKYGQCYICRSTEHFFRECPVFKACQTQVNRQEQGKLEASAIQTTLQGNDNPSTL